MLVRAGATPTRTPVAWLRAHRQDRLSWSLAPLLAPSEYLRKMGRNWLAGVVVAIPSLVVLLAPVGYFKFLGLAGLAGVIASRFRWDRFERDYKQAMQRQQAPAKRNRELLSEALRHLRS